MQPKNLERTDQYKAINMTLASTVRFSAVGQVREFGEQIAVRSNHVSRHLPVREYGQENVDSIVGQWVKQHGPGIHHIAVQVESVEKTMREWQRQGWAEFTSEAPLHCEGLTQVFTKPSELTGVIFEFIERGTYGFCKENVKALMESTKGN